MENIRNIIVGIVGLGIAALTLFVMAMVGLAAIGFAVVVAIVGFLISLFRPRRKVHKRHGPRVWNDGRGTIIDL